MEYEKGHYATDTLYLRGQLSNHIAYLTISDTQTGEVILMEFFPQNILLEATNNWQK